MIVYNEFSPMTFSHFNVLISGKMYLLLDTIESSGSLHRDMGEKLFMAPTLSFMENTLSYSAWSVKYNVMVSLIK
jgi:hypothetical protein